MAEDTGSKLNTKEQETLQHLVVGIGASAGGLEAFRTFFENMPPDSGMAFVLVQHLSPTHKSMLVEILRKSTTMVVSLAMDGAEVLADHVFVIPPDATLTIVNGRLIVGKPAPPREHRRPIDTFFFSLAQDQAESAVCIILSGTGSDGAMGLASIKEHGGVTIAQAEFDHHPKSGMPSSAAATGFVDHILQVQDMPAKLIEHQRHWTKVRTRRETSEEKIDALEHLNKISALLRKGVGHDFTEYKEKTVVRRIQRRMQVLQMGNVTEYIEELRTNPKEINALFRDLLISVTQFFRDPSAFEALETLVISRLMANRGAADQVRVWVPGCATGEEAYTLAIFLAEAADSLFAFPKIMIFATDIDDRALSVARQGRYFKSQLEGVSEARLERWFVQEGEAYAISPQLREMCVFSVHSVVRDPPFSKLDLISCRNLLIYLEGSLQDRLIPIFHYALQPSGFLFLGSSEGIGRRENFFTEVDKKSRIFIRRNDTQAVLPSLPLSGTQTPVPAVGAREAAIRGSTETGVERGARRVMERYAPAHLIVDRNNQVLSFSGQTGKYLDPAPGAASFALFNLLQKPLRPTARTLLDKVAKTGLRAVQDDVPIEVGGKSETITLIVEPILQASGRAAHHIVIFQDADPSKSGLTDEAEAETPATKELESELRGVKARLQAALDETEQANEDLKSVNEEFQSLNEELQSSNEELETSKEEMQSINEELQTVNNELNEKNEAMQRLNSDLKNLLESTEIAILFLDDGLHVRTFTPACTKLFHLRDTDRGRPVTEIASRLSYQDVETDVREVLAKLTVLERQVHSHDAGATFLMSIRPYRTMTRLVDGVVITFVNITEQKRYEETLGRLAAIVSSSHDAIISHTLDGIITSWNKGAEIILGYSADAAVGKPLTAVFNQEEIEVMSPVITRVCGGEAVGDYEIVRRGQGGKRTDLSLTVSPVKDGEGNVISASTIARDISERAEAERHRTLLMAELDHRVKNTLLTVHSIATQTAATATGLSEFSDAFESRLMALSQTHNILTEDYWRGASLRHIVAAELRPYGEEEGPARFSIDGADVHLIPAHSLALGMAFHELATNAAKYGALSVKTGRVEVSWIITSLKEKSNLRLQWIESGGPPVSLPKRSGFGTRLIERGLAHELGGDVTLSFELSGVQCMINVPLKLSKPS